jgi:superfamily II DNA or RNA helicase
MTEIVLLKPEAFTLSTRPNFELRDYQKQAISRTYRLIRSGIRSVLLVAPTGAGKTCIGSRIVNDAVSRGRRVLFLVHRDPLVPQTQSELLTYGIEAGIIKAGYRENRELPVQIASIQSLARRDLPRDIGLVIIDECHTVGWYQAFQEVKQSYSPCGVPALGKTVYVGLTGSPWRSKVKEHFGEHFEAIVQVPGSESPEDEKKFLTVRLIERGFLVPPRNFGWGGYLRSDMLEKAEGEFTQKSIEAAVSHPEFNPQVVKKFLEVCPERAGIVFCASVNQSRELTALFNEASIRCEHIEADTPHQVRRGMYERLRTGETQLLSSVGTLTEGFNVKNISAIVLARPTASEALLIQMCGRGLRLYPGKADCYLLDFCQNFKRLRFITDRREITLCPRPPKPVVGGKECPSCGAAVLSFIMVCPNCGYEFPLGMGNEDSPSQMSLAFGEILSSDDLEKFRYLRSQLSRSYTTKKSPDRVFALFRQRYGHFPPNDWHLGAVFKGTNGKVEQQRYLDFLKMVNLKASPQWIEFHLKLEFGFPDKSYRLSNGELYKPPALDLSQLEWWEVLGCKPLSDWETIKASYSRAIDRCHDDDDEAKLYNLALEKALAALVALGVA